MMLPPRGPSAVPTGGAGLAWPAGICNLMWAMISFAILLCHSERGEAESKNLSKEFSVRDV
jgi:hypothetical protein